MELLAQHFLALAAAQMGRETSLTPEALAWLADQPWPGNVRQLENEIQRAVALSSGPIGPGDLASA